MCCSVLTFSYFVVITVIECSNVWLQYLLIHCTFQSECCFVFVHYLFHNIWWASHFLVNKTVFSQTYTHHWEDQKVARWWKKGEILCYDILHQAMCALDCSCYLKSTLSIWTNFIPRIRWFSIRWSDAYEGTTIMRIWYMWQCNYCLPYMLYTEIYNFPGQYIIIHSK